MAKEKGNVLPIILLLVLILGLVAAVYLVKTQTNILPKAYYPVASSKPVSSTNTQYQNPFDSSSGQNPDSSSIFSGYKNPFEGLK